MTEQENQPFRTIGGVRIPSELFARLDEYCAANKMKPSRTRVIEVALFEFLNRELPEAQPSAPGRKERGGAVRVA